MTLHDELQAAIDAADPVAYYDALGRSGVQYAALAKGVVTADTYGGYIARAYASSVGASIGTTLSSEQWFGLSVDLMRADYGARFLGEMQVDVGWQAIRDYHVSVFQSFGLPPEAWTAYVPLQTAQNSEGLWDAMLSAGSFLGDFYSTATTLLSAVTAMGVDDITQIIGLLATGDVSLETLQDILQDDLSLASWLYHGMIAFKEWGTPGDTGMGAVAGSFHHSETDGVHRIGGSDSVDDSLNGTGGDDIILGYKGDDAISDGSGNDRVYGGNGNDTVAVGGGDDQYDGDFGDDTDDGSVDVISFALAQNSVVIDLSAAPIDENERGVIIATDDGFGDTDKIRNFEKVFLSAHDDMFVFSDSIYVSGVQRLKVEAGGHAELGDIADFSKSDSSMEVMSGQVILPLGEIDDSEEFEGVESLERAPILWLSGFEVLIGSQASDEIQMGDTLWFANGSGGDDYILGYVADEDFLGAGYHGNFEQVIVGGDGDDIVVAGELSERMVGHDAEFELVNSAIQIEARATNSDFDILSYERSSAAVSVTLQDHNTVSAVLSGGYAEGDEAYGFNGVIGSAHDDDLKGNSGDNYLVGGAGDDYIWGYDGDDTIVAGSGVNEVWTGAGKDLVRVNAFDGSPEFTNIRDFTLIDDHLEIDRSRVTNYHVQNVYTIEGVEGRFIKPGLASLTLNDGSVIALNIVGTADGYGDVNIYDWSIFA